MALNIKSPEVERLATELARPLLAGLLYRMNAELVDFNPEHYDAAVSADLHSGKGRHAAGLNFGDSMYYALAWLAGSRCCIRKPIFLAHIFRAHS